MLGSLQVVVVVSLNTAQLVCVNFYSSDEAMFNMKPNTSRICLNAL